ncbi:hypothetical protein JCM8547_000179 [Rhodosporidiobolus lusitaniae]
MAAPPAPDTLPLPPIIKRSTSPASPVPLKSPQFQSPPSPLTPSSHFTLPTGGQGMAGGGAYFSPQPHSPNPSGILLNKGEGVLPKHSDTAALHGRISPGILHSPTSTTTGEHTHGLGVLRVSSPDASTSESGLSSGEYPSTAPSSAVGSPPPDKPSLSTLAPSGTTGSETARAQSPPSPHCHFAPLPKVDNDQRPGTRRSSFTSNRVKPYRGQPERSDSMVSQASSAVDTEEDGHLSPSLFPPQHHQYGDSSVPSASALSQRLSSSLTFAAPPASHSSHSPSRPTSRRSSSSRRSRSPSPPPGVSRSSSRGGHYHGSTAVTSLPHAHPASRSHSPNLSRHASTDALSLHYIEADRDSRGGAALSRTSSKAGSERDGGLSRGGDEEGGLQFASSSVGGGAFGRRLPSVERSRSNSNSPAFPSSSSLYHGPSGSSEIHTGRDGARDRDKEADLHRLEKKAAEGNVDAERAVSPALKALAGKRERSVSRGEGELGKGRREGEEVVMVAPGEEKSAREEGGGELEEVQEEPEEEEEEDLREEEDEEEDEEDEEDEDGSAEEDEEEEEGEREEENEEDGGGTDEEEEEKAHEERKTSKGAAVEVVRWHRSERDEPTPTPSQATSPVPPVSPPPTAASTASSVKPTAPPIPSTETVA